ncbi:hypothetical protein SK069_12795 [Patulibacter brassicae]|uniref:DUF2029 domain-containing protein n=1 Tax=Patulibacter brassicae TaxID=1705717 RepID=A0ABU4VNN5_9ACTN|nr:hypothetical protein [Patulibacter brassicae]MDX8152478.1 hypothetical protein [Patulibacter brassicae]
MSAATRRGTVLALIVAALLLLAGPAAAQGTGTTPAGGTTTTVPGVPVLDPRAGPTDPNGVESPGDREVPPAGHRLSARQAEAIARADPKARRVRRETRGSYDSIFLKGKDRWQLSIYAPGKPLREIGQVIVSDASGRVTESWDGPYVAWTMARGYDGAFGRSITSPWLWGVLTILFLLPFVGVRPLRGPPVPLLLLAGFAVPLAAFNNARLDIAVPTSFALLVALLLWAATTGLRRPRDPDRPRDVVVGVPLVLLLLAGLALLVFRAVLSVVDGNVIDVGYAGVVGADLLGKGQAVYGNFPKGIEAGDTYGPINYLAYLPFEQVWPWSGRWDDLPAAHAAAVAFDAVAAGLLYLVGRRQETDPRAGRGRGVLYAYLWLACPWTAYCLSSNANDALVAAGLALLLLVGTRPLARGLAAGLAGAAKVAPLALVPLLATRHPVDPTVRHHHRGPRLSPGAWAAFGVGILVVVVPTTLLVLDGASLRLLYDRTIGYQAGREAPFMPWGFYGWVPDVATTVARVLAVGFALLVALLPRRHDLTGLAATAAAVLLALQLSTEYWFYLYLVWLLPLVLVGALGDRTLRWVGTRADTAPPERPHGPVPREDAPWAQDAPAGASR